jgi:hypothetical protein
MDGSSCCPRRASAAPLVPGFNDQIRGVASDEGIPSTFTPPVARCRDISRWPTNDAGCRKIGETFFNIMVKTNPELKSRRRASLTTTSNTLAAPSSRRPAHQFATTVAPAAIPETEIT